jgi:hypothetical protein
MNVQTDARVSEGQWEKKSMDRAEGPSPAVAHPKRMAPDPHEDEGIL